MDNKQQALAGAVVLGYMNDDERFIGVVAGNHMVGRLNEEDKEKFLQHPRDFCAVLVLTHFSEHKSSGWSVFSPAPFLYKFPTYVLSAKSRVVLAEFEEEWALVLAHSLPKEPPGHLRSVVFGFYGKKEEALMLSFLARFYLTGKGNKELFSYFRRVFPQRNWDQLTKELTVATGIEPLPF